MDVTGTESLALDLLLWPGSPGFGLELESFPFWPRVGSPEMVTHVPDMYYNLVAKLVMIVTRK